MLQEVKWIIQILNIPTVQNTNIYTGCFTIDYTKINLFSNLWHKANHVNCNCLSSLLPACVYFVLHACVPGN